MSLRRVLFGLATLFGFAERGFFIPYRYAGTLARAGGRADYGAIAALFRAREGAFAALLDRLEAHDEAFRAIDGEPPPAPRWDQDWFPRLDAAIAYALVRDLAPRRVVEIGSGHSTRFIARAVRDGALATKVLAIDPAPRAPIEGLPIEILRRTLDGAGAEPFKDLVSGDFLFVDSSHILMPGSDVDTVLNRILPALPAGIVVQIHDMFLPEDYPADWNWRGYNEQQGVAALLTGGGFEPIFASRYVATAMAERLGRGVLARLPLVPGAYESSLWLRKIAPPVGTL